MPQCLGVSRCLSVSLRRRYVTVSNARARLLNALDLSLSYWYACLQKEAMSGGGEKTWLLIDNNNHNINNNNNKK